MIELKGKYTDANIYAQTIEEGVYNQVYDIINCRAFDGKKVICMPDVHVGASGPCGLVAQIGDFIAPEHVGVDIGCTVSMMILDKKLDESDFPLFEKRIRDAIPFGMEIHKDTVIDYKSFYRFLTNEFNKFKSQYPDMLNDLPNQVTEDWVSSVLKRIGIGENVFYKSLGTIGSGNHFIELDEDENGTQAVTLHFGSRNFGLKVCKYWTNIAKSGGIDKHKIKELTKQFKDDNFDKFDDKRDFKKAMDAFVEEYKSHNINGYLKGDAYNGYLCDMVFAQSYARYNHITVMDIISNILSKFKIQCSRCIFTMHNYVDFRDMTLRKSAISAHKDEMVIIPFNMRDGVALCVGKGNEEWLNSCCHGAGRQMSRNAAKANLSLDEFVKTMDGIYSTCVCSQTLDESPMAYKNTDEIIELIKDTVDVLNLFKPKISMKAFS